MLLPMAPTLSTPHTGAVVIALMTASFGVGLAGTPASAPEGLLPGGTDVLILPIALVVVAAVVFVTIARRRSTAAQAAEAAESEAARADGPGSSSPGYRNVPRWLDPSVAAARFKNDRTTAARATSAIASPPARVPIVFRGPADELTERMLVRYDGVPVLDRPDDVLGQTHGELDGGDEVEILERSEIWARVRLPDGSIGWIPSMTTAALASDSGEGDPYPREATLPEPPLADDDGPGLEALLEAVAAQRLARQELENAAPPPKRPRSRKPRTPKA